MSQGIDPYRTPGVQKFSPTQPSVLHFGTGKIQYRAVKKTRLGDAGDGGLEHYWIIEACSQDALGRDRWLHVIDTCTASFNGASAGVRVLLDVLNTLLGIYRDLP